MAFTINREEVKPKSHSQDFIPSFIRKTYDILEEARFPQYIDWNSEGTALVIKKPSEFSQKVLPIYFKHNNFTSFVRQLNMYDFHKRRTQGLDHVYVHELFQRGKRHLLQEIKRKTHETANEKTPKVHEALETPKSGSEDLSELIKENQLFKHLYNEAMNRLASLERRAKELAVQNQSLATKIQIQNECTTGASIFKPIISKLESQSELTLDQLPMTMGKMTLNLTSSYQAPAQVTRLFSSSNNGAGYMKPAVELQREESSSASTEVSRNSPSGLESEETGETRRKTEVINPFANLSKGFQYTQAQPLRITNELSISRLEMSTGQMIDTWNFEFSNDDVLCFADQKAEKTMGNAQYQDRSLLGKRLLDQNVDMSFYVGEPAMKRHELCVFTKKSIISSGVEDQDVSEGSFYVANNADLIEF